MARPARVLSGDKAWACIRDAARSGPAYVAVAWWGSEMSRLLPLRKGSVLVVRADRATMEQGQTNPWELEKLFKAGVRIFPLSNLHAKVFVFPKLAVIGSMNASANSWQGKLLEAAVEVTATALVGAAKKMVLGWARDKALDQDDFDDLKEQYVPHGGWEGGGAEGRKLRSTPATPRMDLPPLRVIRTNRGDWKQHTQDRYDRDSPALRKVAAARSERLDAIEWEGGNVPAISHQERALEVGTDEDGTLWLSAPARLWRVTGTKTRKPEKLVYLSRNAEVRRRRFSAVAKTLGPKSRLVRLLKSRGQVFRDPEDLERLYGLWDVRG